LSVKLTKQQDFPLELHLPHEQNINQRIRTRQAATLASRVADTLLLD